MSQSIMLNLKAQRLVLKANPSEQSHWRSNKSRQTSARRLASDMPDPGLGAEQRTIPVIGLSGNVVLCICLGL